MEVCKATLITRCSDYPICRFCGTELDTSCHVLCGEKKKETKRLQLMQRTLDRPLIFVVRSCYKTFFTVQYFIQSPNIRYLMVFKLIVLGYDSELHALEFTEELCIEAFREIYSALIETWNKPYQAHVKNHIDSSRFKVTGSPPLRHLKQS